MSEGQRSPFDIEFMYGLIPGREPIDLRAPAPALSAEEWATFVTGVKYPEPALRPAGEEN